MFGRLGTGELMLILGIALIIFGPGKLPEIGKSLGKSISEFKKFSNGIKDDISLDSKDDKKTIVVKETIEVKEAEEVKEA